MPMMDPATLRILDANIDRAREALRVIEDFARFVRDDQAVVAEVKHLRHQLRDIVTACDADALLSARDIGNDVGTGIKTPAELSRTSHDDVVRAACVRLQEASRVLSEYGKLVSPQVATVAEQIRYRAYAIEQTLVLRSTLREKLRSSALYVLVTAELCAGTWETTLRAAIAGGAGIIQLREKELPDAELLARARQAREITASAGALLIVNDRPDIARVCGADGVHVGQDDLSVAEVRRVAGGNLLVGKSTHTLEQFEAASREEPDYLAVGPMFATSTKPQEHIAGVETLRAVRSRTALPLVAIGGIRPEHADELFAAGADALAVCSAVIAQPDVEAAAGAFVKHAARR